MCAPRIATKIRRVVPFILGLSLAATALRLTACFVTPTPTNPHELPDGDLPGELLDPPDAASDALEEPG